MSEESFSNVVAKSSSGTVKIWSEGPVFALAICDDFTHYFDGVGGRCRCGRQTWDTPPKPKLRLVE